MPSKSGKSAWPMSQSTEMRVAPIWVKRGRDILLRGSKSNLQGIRYCHLNVSGDDGFQVGTADD